MKVSGRRRLLVRGTHKFWVRGIAHDAAPAEAAGVMCRAADGALLFLKRAAGGDHGGEWCFPGGGLESGEDDATAARRELLEETGYDSLDGELKSHGTQVSGGLRYTTFGHDVAEPFEAKLNDEHTEAMWAQPDAAPQPLHPGVATLLNFLSGEAKREGANDAALAFDRASVRTIDDNGRMRVEQANISKANVCPYLGKEIPGYEELGLDPKQVYKLLRDPAALAASVKSFNGVPILDTHVPSSAWDHPAGKVIGTTGTDAVWEEPYLKNSLVFWTQDAIDDIESKERQELSCGYKYRPLMEPGDYEGVKYDGRMVDILGNHVALVAAGRAGPDVIVGDSKLELKETGMPKKASPSRMATLAQGALLVALQPVLAADAAIDLGVLLNGVTKANFAATKARIIAAIRPKLAADAELGDIVKLLDTLEKAEGVEDEEPIDTPPANDADPIKAACDMFKAKGATDEEVGQMAEMLKRKGNDAAPDLKPGGTDEDKEDVDKDEKVSKGAMDAALRAASDKAGKDIELAADAAEARTVARLNAIVEARDAVQPYVGRLAMSFDSAEGVYRAALTQLGVKHEGVHETALRPILEAQPKPNERRQQLAHDSAIPDGFATRFPGVASVRTI